MKYLVTLSIVLGLVFGGTLSTAGAHGGVDHATEAEAKEHEVSLEEMEQIIELLKQVVALLILKRDIGGQTLVTIPVVTTPSTDDAMMEEHHTEHSPEPESETVPTTHLIIEVEAHNGNTHVHVRYTDKPEEMFFVTAPLSDEDGVVRQTAERTGLTQEAVREALVYTGIQ
jgi:hypothetical protein